MPATTQPCACNAYPFPHREGGGKCPANGCCPNCGSFNIWPEQSPGTDWWDYCPDCNFEWNGGYDWKGEEAEDAA